MLSRKMELVNFALYETLLQIHPPQQVLESRVGAKAVEFRVDFQKTHEKRPLRVGLFELGEGLVLIAERRINRRNSVGRNVEMLGARQKVPDGLARLWKLALERKVAGYLFERPRSARGDLRGLSLRRNCVVDLALLCIQLAQHVVPKKIVGLKLKALVKFHCRRIVAASEV